MIIPSTPLNNKIEIYIRVHGECRVGYDPEFVVRQSQRTN